MAYRIQAQESVEAVLPRNARETTSSPVIRRMSDAAIESAIHGELWWSPIVDADQVEITVEGVKATLTGEVDSCDERAAATESAVEAAAARVVNKLIVTGVPDPPF